MKITEQQLRKIIREVIGEEAPPGWEGTVKAMKKHKDIDNPWALAWAQKKKGDEPHYKDKPGKPEKKEKYKGEGCVSGKRKDEGCGGKTHKKVALGEEDKEKKRFDPRKTVMFQPPEKPKKEIPWAKKTQMNLPKVKLERLIRKEVRNIIENIKRQKNKDF